MDVTFTTIGALIGLAIAIVLIIKKVAPAYALILGALAGGLYVSLLKIGTTPDGLISNTGYDAVWIVCSLFIVIGLVVVAVFLTGDKTSD